MLWFFKSFFPEFPSAEVKRMTARKRMAAMTTAASRTPPWLASGRTGTRANGGPTEVTILPQFDNRLHKSLALKLSELPLLTLSDPLN
jgi:hypothetical protein